MAKHCSVNYLFCLPALLGVAAFTACGTELSQGIADSEQAGRSLYRPQLGAGVDFSETKTYGQCVTTRIGETPYGMASSLYDEVAVSDRNALNAVLSVDASVSAKTLWGNGGASAGFFKNVQMSSDAFYWLVYADYKLRDRGLDMGGIALTPAAQEILRGPRGLEGFYEACGEYFYSGAQQSATYALLYEFRSAEESTIERIKAAANYDGFGVKAKGSFEKFAQMAMQSSVLKVHAAATGGSERLRSYATSPEQLEEELAKLRDDLYNRGTGVNTQWYMSDYNMFPEVQAAKAAAQAAHTPAAHSLPKLTKEFTLARLYQRHVQNVNVDQRIRAHLARAEGNEPLLGYTPEKRQALYQLLQSLDAQNVALGERAKECMLGEEAASCALGELVVPVWGNQDPSQLMQPDHDYTTLQGWSLMMSMRQNSKVALDFVGKPPQGGRSIEFYTEYSVINSALGLVAGNDLGPEYAVVIGTAARVRDPHDGQLRPNACVYAYKDICSLRMVPLPGKREDGSQLSKLQLVLFDSYGFVQRKVDFPPMNEL